METVRQKIEDGTLIQEADHSYRKDVVKLLSGHDTEIKLLREQTDSLKEIVQIIATKLDRVHSDLASLSSRPIISLPAILAVVKDVLLIMGGLVGGIIYIANANNAAQMALLTERQQANYRHFNDKLEYMKKEHNQ